MTNRLGENPSDEESAIEIISTFYPNDKRDVLICMDEFNKLVSEPYILPLGLKLDFEKKPAEYFIIADTYLSGGNIVELYNHLSGKKKKNISVAMAIATKNEFLQSVDYFKEKWEWIYNPPTISKISKATIGSQLRTEFVQYYGVYSEITYLLSNGNVLKFEEVNQMVLENYLSLGEYLIRKKSVEAVD